MVVAVAGGAGTLLGLAVTAMVTSKPTYMSTLNITWLADIHERINSAIGGITCSTPSSHRITLRNNHETDLVRITNFWSRVPCSRWFLTSGKKPQEITRLHSLLWKEPGGCIMGNSQVWQTKYYPAVLPLLTYATRVQYPVHVNTSVSS